MKKVMVVVWLCTVAAVSAFAQGGSVGVNTNTPNGSAVLDIYSNDKGVLIPRVALTDVNQFQLAGNTQTPGIMVYNTAANVAGGNGTGFYIWEDSKWKKLVSASDNYGLEDIGVISAFPGATYPNNIYLPLSGGTFNNTDYPEFAAFIANLDADVVTDNGNGTFTLADWNSNGEFLRGQGGAAAGVGSLQTDATSLPNSGFTTAGVTVSTNTAGNHSHAVNLNTSTNGAHSHSYWYHYTNIVEETYASGSGYGQVGWISEYWSNTGTAGDHTHNVSGNTANSGDHSHSVSVPSVAVNGGGDSETRPVNRSVTWVLKVKPSPMIVSDFQITNNIDNSVTSFSSIVGDVKNGMQTTDHNGWVKLDGRSISSLTPTQQSNAALLGLSGNLPNATDKVLKQSGSVGLAGTGGSNTRTLTQANLPNVTFSGSTNSAGSHNHNFYTANHDTNSSASQGYPVGDNHNAFRTTDRVQRTENRGTIHSNGAHTHTVTVSSGGSGTPFSVEDSFLSVNTFIYLGQ